MDEEGRVREMPDTNSNVLAVSPAAIEFPVHGRYTTRLRVQNTGTKSCSMHLRPIRSPCISVKAFSPVLRLAPGMHVYIQIGYDSAASSAEPLDDEITVKYEGGSITIPVTLQSSSPRFQVSGELEWGMVCAGTDLVKQVQVVNSGTSSGTWTMRIESDCKMEVSPSSGDLQPGSSAEVTLCIPEIDPGELLCHLLLSSGDMALIHRYSITVQAVVATVELQGELGQPLHEIDFGASLNNGVIRKTMLIMNGSPAPAKFAIEVISIASTSGKQASDAGDEEAHTRLSRFVGAARTRAQSNGRRDMPFQIVPTHGEVAPFQKAAITVTYAPTFQQSQSGFTANLETGCAMHRFMGRVEIHGRKDGARQVLLKGRCELRVVSVIPQYLHFGVTMPNTATFCIQNKAKDTTVHYQIRKIPAFFRIEGSKVEGMLCPQATAMVTVKYKPKSLGNHSGGINVLVLTQAGSIVEQHVVTVAGSSGKMPSGKLDLTTVPSRVSCHSKHVAVRNPSQWGNEDSLALGLDTWGDLGTGDPGKLPIAKDTLWTANTSTPTTFTPFPGVPIAKANITPFKEWPETNEEEHAMSVSLSCKQIRSIVAGPAVLNFGTCSSGIATTKPFFVVNTLAQPVHVVLDAQSYDHLVSSVNSGQVIPAGQTAMFPITLKCASSRPLHHDVDIVVNGNHFLHFTVQADIVDPTVKLSHADMDFLLSAQDWLSHCDKLLLMENSQPVGCSYEWCNPMPGVFSVAPMFGHIPPYSSAEALIRWTPPPDSVSQGSQKQHCNLALKVNGSTVSLLRLRGQSPEAKLQCKPKAVDLGTICLGLPVKLTASIVNDGQLVTAFRSCQMSSNTTCYPSSGILAAHESASADIIFIPSEVGSVKKLVNFEQRGGPIITMAISSEVRLPKDIWFAEEELSFGTLYKGASKKLPITLVNSECFFCEVEIDLTNEHLFTLSLGPEQWHPSSNTESPLQECLALEPGHQRKPAQGCKYRVALQANSNLVLMLHFNASDVRSISMLLPATVLCGDLCPPCQLRQGLHVSAESLETRLSVSTSQLDFGSCVVLPCGSTPPKPIGLSFTITNQQSRPMVWSFGNICWHDDRHNQDVFQVDQQDGVLQPNACCTILVFFLPDLCIKYAASMELFASLTDEASSLPILTLELAGTGRSPGICFDAPFILLPAVPLGLVSSAQFTVINDGYDNVDFTYRLPADEEHLPLQLDFPQGTVIGMAKSSVPAIVSFCSDRPTSFTCDIEILDETGSRYVLSVSGCTDCFSATLQPFISCNCWKPSPALEAPTVRPTHNLALPDASSVLEVCLPNLSSLVTKYIQCKTNKHVHDNFVEDIMFTKGKALIDAIEALSGKAVSGKLTNFSADPVQGARQFHAQCVVILTHLQSYGGLVNMVRPEALLDKECLLQYLRSTSATDPKASRQCQLWEQLISRYEWEIVNAHSWIYCVFQSIRVFALQTITMASLTKRRSSYLETSELGSKVYCSSILSQQECILLAWLQLHTERVFPHLNKRISNLDDDLGDGLALCSVLVAHWPALAELQAQLIVDPVQQADAETNMAIFQTMLSALRCPFVVSIDEMLPPQPCSLLFLVAFLYEWLPQLLPYDRLQFDGKLQTEEVKCLELTNSASKPLAYSIHLEGHQDFSVAAAHLHIEPESKAVLPVRCIPSSGAHRSANLIMTSQGDAATQSKTLVFNLDSKVQTEAPLRIIKAEKPLYELKRFEFSVSNPFPSDCEFAISLEQRLDVDKDDNPHGKYRATDHAQSSASPNDTNARVPPAFGIVKQSIRLSKGADEKVRAVFLPLTPGVHGCLVRFTDVEQGCFCYELIGRALHPATYSEHEFIVDIKTTQLLVPLSPTNAQVEGAKKLWQQQHPLAKNKEIASLVKTWHLREQLDFEVEHVSGIVQCPGRVTIFDKAGSSDKAVERNYLQLGIKPVGLGLYPDRIMLKSQYETRVIDVMINVQELEHTYSLGFCCKARQDVVQQIPLLNSADKAIAILAEIVQDASIGPEKFIGPTELTVPASVAGYYPLTFHAPVPGVFKASLTLTATATKERWVYSLEGQVTDPPAVSHVTASCQAGDRNALTIEVPNHSPEDITYCVFTDLPVIHGESTLTVPAGGVNFYTMNVLAALSGTYTGTITFTNSNGNYEWFAVSLEVLKPPELACLRVEAEVGAASELMVNVTNPCAQHVTLTACYDAYCGLVGPDSYQLAPWESQDLKLYFCPASIGSNIVCLKLACPAVGEFWYELNLNAVPSDTGPPHICGHSPPAYTHDWSRHKSAVLPSLECALGERTSMSVSLPPWLNSVRDYIVRCHPETCFRVESNEDHRTQPGIAVSYAPQTVKQVVTGQVWVECGASKCMIYSIQGICLPPTTKHYHVSAKLGSSTECPIVFYNPFAKTINVAICPQLNPEWDLDLDAVAGKVSLGGSDSMQLSLLYRPTANGPSCSEAQILFCCCCPEIQEEVEFLYTVTGQIDRMQSFTTGLQHSFSTQPGIRTEKVFRVTPPSGISLIYPCTVHVDMPVDTKHLIGELTAELGSPDACARLPLRVEWAPSHAVQHVMNMKVKDKHGNGFPIKIEMLAMSPEPERTILCHAPPGSSVVVPFPLHTPDIEQKTDFISYFSPESSACFDVRPRKGSLRPEHDGGGVAALEIIYNNTGKPKPTALLIVQTKHGSRYFAFQGQS